MKILAVDTALPACSVAIFDSCEDRILAKKFEPMATGHAERLAPMVREVMAAANQDFASLGRIAATVGPGTFTGLRIGLSFARGLALALGKPVVGLSTLRVLAAMTDNPNAFPIAAAIDARRGNIYFQLFTSDLWPMGEPRICSSAEAAEALPEVRCIAVGSGAPLLSAAAEPHRLISDWRLATDAATVAAIAGRDENLLPPNPLYLRSHDAKPDASFLPHVAHQG
ncbi:MAG TPA: tRNA (adenosine(37)-N6)-threonylcarbamoyltransferase complex dimerization subunit type 1 TsaB [Luteolibacter sp.]|jgi:tRNA threonylcarbamoyladenosine biosynthesis protein TsaB